jgi:tetratricopeptide (TPR) repeat protein
MSILHFAATDRAPAPADVVPIRRPRSGGNMAWGVATGAILAAAVWVVYGPALDAPFLFDDVGSIAKNESIKKLWPLAGESGGFGPLTPPPYFSIAGRPLVNLTLAINYHFGQLDPRYYHLFNILVHFLSAVLLAAIVRRTLCLDCFGGRFDSAAGPLALAVALVWALHPLQTEAVVYVTQRTELLMGFFYLATLYGSLHYWTAESSAGRGTWLIVATIACMAGMACKEVMVSAPLVVLLFDRAFVSGSLGRAMRNSWPLYVGLALGWCVLAALNYNGPRSSDAGFHLGVAAQAWWFTQAKVLLMYLKLAIWPWPLVIHYEMPYLESIAVAWPYLLPVALLAVATLVLLWRNRPAGYLAASAWLILSPTLVVPITTEVAAERRMYLPLAALVALVVVGGCYLLQRLAGAVAGDRSIANTRRWPVGATVAAALCWALPLSAVSVRRVEAYQDNVTIWSDAAAIQPENTVVRTNLGLALFDAGEALGAIDQFQRVLTIKNDPEAHTNLGRILLKSGRAPEAVEHYQAVVLLKPAAAESHYNLGIALLQGGRLHDAVDECAKAVHLKPDSAEAQYNLGVTLLSAGRALEAIPRFQEALRLRPNYVEAMLGLGNALYEVGRTQEAVDQFEQAVRLEPEAAEPHANLGAARLRMGQAQAAIDQFQQAVRMQADVAESHYNLAMALVLNGQPGEAADQFELAVRLKPEYAEAWANLATARARQERSSDAIAAAEKALELARAQNNRVLEQQLQSWLKAYGAAIDPVRSP